MTDIKPTCEAENSLPHRSKISNRDVKIAYLQELGLPRKHAEAYVDLIPEANL